MQIVVMPGRLKDGVTEEQMLALSAEFQDRFVSGQPGIVGRYTGKDAAGGYADIIVFRDAAAMEAVMTAEQDCPEAAAFMAVWEGGEPLMFDILQDSGM
jgi:hypothetical protein